MTQILVNTGYFLMLCGFLVRDILWLRSLLIGAQVFLAVYGWTIDRMPVACWNIIFAIINAVWVVKILRERRPVTVPHDLRDLHGGRFAMLSPREFIEMWRAGREVKLTDAPLVREGERPRDLMLVLEGRAVVRRGGEKLVALERGRFIADMSFLTGQAASADVWAEGPVRVQAWDQSMLLAWRTERPALFSKLQGVLGHELVEKLRHSNHTLEFLHALREGAEG